MLTKLIVSWSIDIWYFVPVLLLPSHRVLKLIKSSFIYVKGKLSHSLGRLKLMHCGGLSSLLRIFSEVVDREFPNLSPLNLPGAGVRPLTFQTKLNDRKCLGTVSCRYT